MSPQPGAPVRKDPLPGSPSCDCAITHAPRRLTRKSVPPRKGVPGESHVVVQQAHDGGPALGPEPSKAQWTAWWAVNERSRENACESGPQGTMDRHSCPRKKDLTNPSSVASLLNTKSTLAISCYLFSWFPPSCLELTFHHVSILWICHFVLDQTSCRWVQSNPLPSPHLPPRADCMRKSHDLRV